MIYPGKLLADIAGSVQLKLSFCGTVLVKHCLAIYATGNVGLDSIVFRNGNLTASEGLT
jgi:hypothetical protein